MKNWFSKIQKYLKEKNRFIIQNPITFQQKFSLTLTKRNTIIVISGFTILFGAIVFLIISFTSLKNMVPGFPSKGSELYRIDKDNQLKINQLAAENKNRNLWIKNLQSILTNKDSISIEKINQSIKNDSNFDYKSIVFERIKEDSILRKNINQLESKGKYFLAKTILLEVLSFEMPLDGKIIEESSNAVNSFLISCKKKENIVNPMDGRVISQTENLIIIQHQHELVTTIHGVTKFKTKVGEWIERGSRIGVTTDTTMTFQLWYKGESLPLNIVKN